MGIRSLSKSYVKALAETILQGDAREESCYPALRDFLLGYADSTGRKGIHVTVLPKPTEVGNPDFRVWDGRQHIIGYIEAKPATVQNLEPIAETEQLTRYLQTFPNLILTNFLEFRLYRNGSLIAKARLGRPFVATRLRTQPPLEQVEEFAELLELFFSFSLPKAYTAESLAVELAKRTRFLRDQVVLQELARERERGGGHLLGFYEAFRKHLIAGLTLEDFADLYAQTITYGLFAARVRAGEDFNRREAFYAIPHTIGVLRDLFRFISLEELPPQLEWIVDDIAEVLAVADVQGLLHQYFHEGKGADPIVHFCETFLSIYDPEERERRGVYYTPEPVVSYIVRSLHQILKEKFGKPDGLASPGVTLLDPAAGTMTFVAEAAKVAVEEFVGKYGEAGRGSFIRDHILENFYAFELMMAPYAVGHLKMALILEELGYKVGPEERFKFYLTNALEMEELAESQLPGLASLAEESHKAGEVKREVPILVILGNPPYSGHSANKGPWIRGLIEDYKKVDGKPLGEKNPKWLQDDYVKFLRFAEWKIAQAGHGVVGMITNHSYLDNPTFRGMRQHLMQTFDEIYVLDLHGNSLKRERCPDGSPDENVFDIQQGVAIAFFVNRKKKSRGAARVYHAELWGRRGGKYAWLHAHSFDTTSWQEIKPSADFYLFSPRDDKAIDRYKRFVSVQEIFPVHGVGIITRKDKLTIRWSEDEIWTTVLNFSRLDPELARSAYNLGEDTTNWKVVQAQQDIIRSGPSRRNVVPVLYRPFDIRYTYYTGRSSGFHSRPCREVMRHMLAGENVSLITPKQHKGEFGAFIATSVGAHKTVAAYDINYYFPLHLYPETERDDLFSKHGPSERQPNLNTELVQKLAGAFGGEPAPQEIFHYVYAVLYAPSYREKYGEFLRIDFPRIPFTADYELFKRMAELGKRLVDLHLLRSSELDPPIARFQGEGDGKVEPGKKGLRYDAKSERVYINESQYFECVPPEVWECHIGGYQVCSKWLKDRKGRKLTLDEIRTYCRIVTALAKTLELQLIINKLYHGAEKRTSNIRPVSPKISSRRRDETN